MQTAETRLLLRAEAAIDRRDYRAAHADCMAILKANPRSSGALFLLGIVAADHDNHAKAIEIYDRALAIDAGVGRYLAWKAKSLLILRRRSDAIEAAEAAAEGTDLSALTLDTIGVVFSRAGLHERAVDFYRRAAALAPEQAGHWLNLGAAEQFLGNFDDAISAFRKVLERDTGNVKAWASLSQIGAIDDATGDLQQLKALFPALTDADDRLHIGHAIARAAENAGHQAEAMDWLARAKCDKAAKVNYSPDADAPIFSAATALVSPWAGPAPGASTDPSPIFIVGLPRTGTTLIDRVLSSHDSVVSAGELADFSLVVKRATGTPSRFVLDSETLRAAVGADPHAVAKDYLSAARKIVPDAPRFVDKMPLNVFYAPLILRTFENARIICLLRHPADSVLSNYKQLFATSFSYYNYAYRLEDTAHYVVRFRQLVDALESGLPADRFTTVSYENVVADLETEARRLLEFCGLDWQDGVLNFHENAAPVATASSVQVRQPIYTGSVGRWRRAAHALKPALDILAEAGVMDRSEVDSALKD